MTLSVIENHHAAGQHKITHKTLEMTENVVHGNSSKSTKRELSNEYQHTNNHNNGFQ